MIHLGLVCFVTILRAAGIDMPVDGSSAPLPLVEWGIPGALGAGWLVLHHGCPPRWAVHASDVVVPLLLAAIYVRLTLDRLVEAGMVVLVLVSLTLVLRAALVPSTLARTVAVGLVGESSAVVGSFRIAPEADPVVHVWVGALGLTFVAVTTGRGPAVPD